MSMDFFDTNSRIWKDKQMYGRRSSLEELDYLGMRKKRDVSDLQKSGISSISRFGFQGKIECCRVYR